MSRVIEQIATVQFQVNARQASAAMQALQGKAKELGDQMDGIKQDIANLGEGVPKDHPEFVRLSELLKGVKKDYDDVTRAQRDFMKGVKAADQLLKAAQEQNIESLSFRSIKAGVNGLRKRQEGLSPGDAQDMKDWRVIENVINEADRVVKQARADVENTIQVIRDGGKVSEQAMRQTISALKDLKGSMEETEADYRNYGQQLDFMEGKLQEYADAQRRAKGEIVDANDARREMNKLTEEGRRQAEFQKQQADWEVRFYEQKNQQLTREREGVKAKIDQTQQQIDQTQKLIEQEHRALEARERLWEEDVKDNYRINVNEAKRKAQAERDLADAKKEAAEEQIETEKYWQHQVTETGNKITEIKTKLEELSQKKLKPQVDTSELDELETELVRLKGELENVRRYREAAEAKKEAAQQALGGKEIWENERYVKAREEDVAASQAAVKKLDNKWDAYWDKQEENAKKFAEVLKKSIEDVTYEDFQKNVTGPNSELAKSWYRKVTRDNEGLEIWTDDNQKGRDIKYFRDNKKLGLATPEQLEELKLLEGLKRKWDEYWKARDKAEGDRPKSNAVFEELDKYKMESIRADVAIEASTKRALELKQQIADKEQEIAKAKQQGTQTTKESNETTEEENRLQQELTETQAKNAKAQEELTKAKQDSAKATGEYTKADQEAIAAEDKLADAQKKASDAQAEHDRKMQEGEQKIKDLSKTYEGLKTQQEGYEEQLEKNSKQQAENNQNIAASEAKKQQAQQLTIQRMEEMLAVLRKANREDIPANTKQWRENEAEINRLSGALEKMKEAARIDLIKVQGQEALSFFNDKDTTGKTQADAASTAETADKVKALAAYRDVLPKDTDAAVFERIDEILREQAKLLKETTGEWMTYDDAVELASKAGGEGFLATTQQMQQAVQAMERQRDSLIKTIQLKKKNGEATAKEEIELKRLEKELKDLKFEQDNFNMSYEKMEQLLKEPTKAADLDELKAAIKRADGELHRMKGSLGENSKEYQIFAEKVKIAKNNLKEMEGQAKATSTAWEKAWSRLKTYVGLYMGFNVLWQKFTGTADDLMQLSDKMGEVRKTTGFTADEVGRLSESLKTLDTRTTITGLLDLSVAAGQLGLKTQEDVEGFTIAANKLMVALPEMGKEGATEMLKVALATGEIDKIRRQMEEGLIEGSSATAVAMEKVGSTIDRLRATSAATAPAITDFVKRVGAVGAQSGISIDQVAALGSTVDALGMRVEMSATALSRMVPAIKNNAFAIGQVIGKTEEYIKTQFAKGKGMSVILDIFDAIKKSGKKSADDIEAMFGGSMQEIMKELNQQGARAGIVFAGLSQNVDELRRQLGVAAKAYKENIAIQQEYDKMNETTAAKWERFKNQLEEFFVGDASQRFLGGIIDGLRKVLDLLTDDGWGKFLRYAILFYSMMKAKWAEAIGNAIMSLGKFIWSMRSSTIATEADTAAKIADAAATNTLEKSTERATVKTTLFAKAWGKLNAVQKANVIAAVATALIWLGNVLLDVHAKAKEAAEEIGRFNKKLSDEKRELDSMFGALKDNNLAHEERKKLIAEINAQYGKYLGYMLSETNTALQLADAHALIAKRIREEAYERRIAEKEKKIREEYDDEMNENYGNIVSRVRKGAKAGADVEKIADDLKSFVDRNLDRIEKRWGGGLNLDPAFRNELNGFLDRLAADGKVSKNSVDGIRSSLITYMNTAKDQHVDIMKQTSSMRSDLRGIQGAIQTDLTNNLKGLIGSIANASRQQTPAAVGPLAPKPQAGPTVNLPKPAWQGGNAEAGFVLGFGGKETSYVNVPLPGDRPKIDEKNIEQVREYVKAQDNLRGWLSQYAQTISKSDREAAEAWLDSEEEVNRLRKTVAKADVTNPNSPSYNPYGNFTVMDSYDKWSADALVDRKKQMLQYVRAMSNGADVQAILSQDKKFMDEATRKGIKNVRDAIEWYNTERLKIQEELADRHLTNEGQWANPSKRKGRKTRMPMAESAIAELERYYQWRKEVIEEKRAEEGMSEAEYNRRLEALEMEHLQKRSDLRKSYITEDKKFVTQFRDWWKSVRELDAVEWELIEAEVKVATERDRKYIGMNAQKDLTSMNAIVVKQLNAIEDIINKERPFNGITDNLEENLTKMRILFADFDQQKAEALKRGASKDELDKIDAASDAERMKRLSWLLGQADDAYTLSIEELMKRMGDAGMQSLVDALNSSENGEKMKRALLAQLHQTYDSVQDAIRKEASQIKKQVDIAWKDALLPDGSSLKGAYEKAISALGLEQDRVQRANQLIGAGQASERVADKLAIKQMQVRLAMQQHYYNLIKQKGLDHIKKLEQEAELLEKQKEFEQAAIKRLDIKHAKTALAISDAEEMTKVMEQQNAIANQLEESQNRLYTHLREWGDLLANSVREVMEASNAGLAEYYNERAKLDLTGKGGPGAGTYVVIDNAGTSDATAHYEQLDERQALERQLEIERQNAQAEAWKKIADDLNMKMNEQITDMLNAQMQNASIDANTDATLKNTEALIGLSGVMQGKDSSEGVKIDTSFGSSQALETGSGYGTPKATENAPAESEGAPSLVFSPEGLQQQQEMALVLGQTIIGSNEQIIESSDKVKAALDDQFHHQESTAVDTNKKIQQSTQSMFAKMTQAANLYGIAYQAMSNDNLSTAQKFQMIAVQAAGNAAIAMLTADLAQSQGETADTLPVILAKCLKIDPIWGSAIFAALSATIGGLMGMAVSKITKSKSEIAQVTGASANAGRLTTGMLTYAEGNVNEFSDPASLTVGRSYNVDAADGRTYRARYMGRNPKTHLTSGPEFHLSGERGREMIIDAGTTRQITMNEGEIWHAIQTLSAGGRLSATRRRRGVRAFADGNVDDFEEMTADGGGMMADGGMGFDPVAMQASLDRNSAVQEALLERLSQPIQAKFDVYGKGGLVDSYDTGKKTVTRHGERY